MSRLFDAYVMVDWSSRSVPSPAAMTANALWVGVVDADGENEPRYFRTRAAAMAWLADYLGAQRVRGNRVLAGFDFPFGYPRGFARRLTGRPDALSLWSWFADRIRDEEDNSNNRYAVAAAVNRMLGGQGPFWGRPRSEDFPEIPEKKSQSDTADLPHFRLVETIATGAKSCWQLAYAGSVGGQILTGLPALHRLRADPRLSDATAAWPFDSGLAVPEVPIVLAEIYPSLVRQAVDAAHPKGGVKGATQVRIAAAAFAALDAEGQLGRLFAGAPQMTPEDQAIVASEEAWILGAGHQEALRAAAARGVGSRQSHRSDAETPAAAPRLRNDCFALPPGVDWVPVEDALARLRDGLSPVAQTETVPLAEAGGRILAQDLRAVRAHPPCANSAVDGYGFAAAALGPGAQRLPLAPGRAAAGAPYPGVVPPGQALRVLTGAMLPGGVDTVILQEDVAQDGPAIRFARGLKPGANTRPLGEDVEAGAVILPAERRLAPQDLALAASAGLGGVLVRRRLRVGVLSTGDELRPAGTPVAPHQIHDANRPMLLDMLRRWDFSAVDLGQAPDDPAAVAAALDRGAAKADAILTSGGASAGDEDHVSALLKSRGALATWRIAVKPGRPLALGLWNGVPVFGLPGNPVAAFVGALIFARPALGLLAGAGWTIPRPLLLPAAFAKSKKAGRREYLRARLSAEGAVEAFASEGSGRVSGLAWAEGLAELEDGAREIRRGDPVRWLSFAEFGL